MAEKIKPNFISGTGRRKTAVARVFIWQDKGDITINGKDAESYFKTETEQNKWIKPFHIIGISHPKAKYSASIKVQGSGKNAQIDAIVHALSRALSKLDPEFDKSLRKAGLLTRDDRMVERKKPFLHKARKAPQYSKR